ncbi:MAG: class I SAM-dependent methyltransferase [Dehalococcoidia bacterium]
MAGHREDSAAADATAFHDPDVVAAYRHRPPYPEEVFAILTDLIAVAPRRVLDVGCGSGEIARALAGRVEHVDAVDVSPAMIETGKHLPGGNDPRLWRRCGAVEDTPLDPP